jgi:hypothetical protein
MNSMHANYLTPFQSQAYLSVFSSFLLKVLPLRKVLKVEEPFRICFGGSLKRDFHDSLVHKLTISMNFNTPEVD